MNHVPEVRLCEVVNRRDTSINMSANKIKTDSQRTVMLHLSNKVLNASFKPDPCSKHKFCVCVCKPQLSSSDSWIKVSHCCLQCYLTTSFIKPLQISLFTYITPFNILSSFNYQSLTQRLEKLFLCKKTLICSYGYHWDTKCILKKDSLMLRQ